MNTTRSGILSVGAYLPPDIRTNDWWSSDIVDAWTEKRKARNLFREREVSEVVPSEGARLALEAMAATQHDPFSGVRERRIRAANMLPSEMEIAAAKDAIARAGIDPQEIGLVLSTSQGADTLLVANAAVIHHALGLRRNCLATGVDGVCNSLTLQMTLADAMIRTGQTKYALLVQSSTISSVMKRTDPISPAFGDAATAIVLGPVQGDHGLLSVHHEAHGNLYRALMVGNPNGPWYDAVPQVYVDDPAAARQMAMGLADFGKAALTGALEKSGLSNKDINFIATHQGTSWLRRVTQELVDAPQARACDTFSWTGTVGPSNVPLCMAMAEREGILKAGDVVAGFTGGAGTTIAGFILRWGA